MFLLCLFDKHCVEKVVGQSAIITYSGGVKKIITMGPNKGGTQKKPWYESSLKGTIIYVLY